MSFSIHIVTFPHWACIFKCSQSPLLAFHNFVSEVTALSFWEALLSCRLCMLLLFMYNCGSYQLAQHWVPKICSVFLLSLMAIVKTFKQSIWGCTGGRHHTLCSFVSGEICCSFKQFSSGHSVLKLDKETFKLFLDFFL